MTPNPDIKAAKAWNLKGDALLAQSDFQNAAQAYRRAVELQPDNASLVHDLGRSLLHVGQFAEAESVLQQASALNPEAWAILCDLGTAQLEGGRFNNALDSFAKAAASEPSASLAHLNHGNALLELGRLEEAEASYKMALELAPDFVPNLVALSGLISDLGRPKEAQTLLLKANLADPDSALVRQAYALMGLRHGALREGFNAFDARFEPSRYALPTRPFTAPWWQGEDLTGRDILIWTEQGLGDEILAASMFPEVITRAKSCVIECSLRIAPLFHRTFPGAKVVERSDPPHSAVLGQFDYQSPALSLAKTSRSEFAAFPKHEGYLRVDESMKERLRQKYLAVNPDALVVGIAWDSTARHGARKRLPLEAWEPILKTPGVTFISLQYGVFAEDPEVSRLGKRLIVDSEIDAQKNLDDSAAQVAAMDLVITVSNTTAHLAGAQGLPVWTLLPSGPGSLWYWFRDRADSPWYPSMRIFRQKTPGAWQHVVDNVASCLVETKPQGRL